MPVEFTDKYKRVRVMSPSKCMPGSFRTIDLSPSAKGVICKPKGMGGKTRLQSKLYVR